MELPSSPPDTPIIDSPPDFHASVRRYSSEHHRHAHDHVQLLVCLSGQLDLQIEQRSYQIDRGQALLIAPEDSHAFEGRLNPICLVLDTPAPISALCSHSLTLPLDWHSQLHYLRQRLEATPDDPLLQCRIRQQSLAWFLPATTTNKRVIDFKQLDNWIEQQLAEDITIEQLAALCHWSVAHFRERFTEEVGIPPAKLIQHRRIQLAKQLFSQDVSVATVASRCGYKSPSALTAMLKHTLGLTPRDIKRQSIC